MTDSIIRALILPVLLAGCATAPLDSAGLPAHQALPTLQGSYHHVKRGETLWRIAHSYGIDIQALAAANRLPSTNALQVGQKLFIPLPPETSRFLWPVRGSLKTAGGSQGVEIAATPGSLVRASRSGQVAVAARHLAGWGKTVVLDHADGYLTVYSGLDQVLVAPGARVRQGMPLGNVGSRALHFEIRYGDTPRNVLALLPAE